MADTQCSAQVIYDSWCHTHQCEKRAKVTRNGKPYCTVHDPEYIAKKGAERIAKFDAEWASKKAEWALEETAVGACKAINPDNPIAVAESISDLYEALKAMLEWAKLSDSGDTGMWADKNDPAIVRANQAIAKAEGGE